MTNALITIGCIAGILYGILVDGTFFKIYIPLVIGYAVIFNGFLVNKKHTTKRKNINVTSWNGKNALIIIC